MANKYKYIDPELFYTNRNGILRNIAKIDDEKVLIAFESFKVSKRIEELSEKPIKMKDSNSLLEIHHYLFQDVYEWAGKVRIVNISKNGKQFFDGERFNMGFQYIDTLITEYSVLNKKNRKEIASKKETEEHKENF